MSLNACPFAVCSEELALQDAMQGLEIRREWSEQELVISTGCQMIPGTPDGMFEEHPVTPDDPGKLTCVQVVRLPVNEHMSQQHVEQIIYDTVLAKVVKSQHWMKASQILPAHFLIFVWLPPLPHGLYPTICGGRTEELLDRMRAQGWPFYWKVKVPTKPGDLFPAQFAFHKLGKGVTEPRRRKAVISEADLSTFCSTDFESDKDDDDSFEYDIFASLEVEDGLADGCAEKEADPSPFDPTDLKDDKDDDDSFEYDIFAIREVENELAVGCVKHDQKEKKVKPDLPETVDFVVAPFNHDFMERAMHVARQLRLVGKSVDLLPEPAKKVAKAFNYADRVGAARIAFVAPGEWERGTVMIKDLRSFGKDVLDDQKQKEVPLNDLANVDAYFGQSGAAPLASVPREVSPASAPKSMTAGGRPTNI